MTLSGEFAPIRATPSVATPPAPRNRSRRPLRQPWDSPGYATATLTVVPTVPG